MTVARRGGRPPRVAAATFDALRQRLRSPPSAYGYSGERWTGALLADFLKHNYAVKVTARHGRRLLAQLGIRGRPRRPIRGCAGDLPAPATGTGAAPVKKSRPAPGALDKEISLKRIRRLSSSGLPLLPFVLALWDLLQATVPYADNKVFLADPGTNPSAYLMNNPDLAKWVPIQKHYYIDAPPEVSGMRISFGEAFLARMLKKPVWRSEEWTLPYFYRSEGYNEFLRPLGFHHMAWLVFSEAGKGFGYLPMWRGEQMPPFAPDELRFLALAAPHITHGLKLAYLQDASGNVASAEFLATPDGCAGIATLDEDGRLIALDSTAEAIFSQMALLSGAPVGPLDRGPNPAAFAFVSQVLRQIFEERGRASGMPPPPFTRIYSHRTGIVVTLRGFAPRDLTGSRHFCVLIEPGELRRHRRSRSAIRWALSRTDIAVLDGLRDGLTNRELSGRLRVSPATARSYLQRLNDKLELPGLPDLRRFARDAWV